LGLGLPWMIASIYHAAKGNSFKVNTGSLGFSVTIYTIVCGFGLGILMFRRQSRFCGYAELGGPTGSKRISAILLVSLWIVYIVLSAMHSYGHFPQNIF